MHEDFVFQALVFIFLSSNEIYPRAKRLALQEQETAARTFLALQAGGAKRLLFQ
jgi:hypothetical protein